MIQHNVPFLQFQYFLAVLLMDRIILVRSSLHKNFVLYIFYYTAFAAISNPSGAAPHFQAIVHGNENLLVYIPNVRYNLIKIRSWKCFFSYSFETDSNPLDQNRFSAILINHVFFSHYINTSLVRPGFNPSDLTKLVLIFYFNIRRKLCLKWLHIADKSINAEIDSKHLNPLQITINFTKMDLSFYRRYLNIFFT